MKDFQASQIYAAEREAFSLDMARSVEQAELKRQVALLNRGAGKARLSPQAQEWLEEKTKRLATFPPLWAVAQCQTYVDNVCSFFKKSPVKVKDGRDQKNAYGQEGEISLPRWARIPIVILHELAHSFNDAQDLHDPMFARIFLTLVDRFLGDDAYSALRQAFERRRVEVA